MQTGTSPGINPPFDRLFRCPGHVTCFVLSLTPLVLARSYDQARLVRLACLNHAASVRSEPGSNSSLGKLCHKTRLIATGESVTCVFQHTTWPSRPLPAGTTCPPVARGARGRLRLGHTPALLGLELFTCQRTTGPCNPGKARIIRTHRGLSTAHQEFFYFSRTPAV